MGVRIVRRRDSKGGVFIYWLGHNGEMNRDYVWSKMSEVFARSSYKLDGPADEPVITNGSLRVRVLLENCGPTYAQIRVIQEYDGRDPGMTQMIRKAVGALETK